MRYPEPRYEIVSARLLRLHSFDGTYRLVLFGSAALARRAMSPGRAELDSVAVREGMLPHGSSWASAAGADLRAGRGINLEDPLGGVQQQFFLRRLVERSRKMDRRSDEAARACHPELAERYDRATRDHGC